MNMHNSDGKALQKEIFHRVSNNFQIVQSMIRLVARDGSIRDKPKELEERIQLLSIAHHALHCLDSARLFPVAKALPNLIIGVQQSGFLAGRAVTCDVSAGQMSVQRTYALLHVVLEAVRVIDRSSATQVNIDLTSTALTIETDAAGLEVNQTTAKLATAFARELGQAPRWSDTGMAIAITPEAAS